MVVTGCKTSFDKKNILRFFALILNILKIQYLYE